MAKGGRAAYSVVVPLWRRTPSGAAFLGPLRSGRSASVKGFAGTRTTAPDARGRRLSFLAAARFLPLTGIGCALQGSAQPHANRAPRHERDAAPLLFSSRNRATLHGSLPAANRLASNSPPPAARDPPRQAPPRAEREGLRTDSRTSAYRRAGGQSPPSGAGRPEAWPARRGR